MKSQLVLSLKENLLEHSYVVGTILNARFKEEDLGGEKSEQAQQETVTLQTVSFGTQSSLMVGQLLRKQIRDFSKLNIEEAKEERRQKSVEWKPLVRFICFVCPQANFAQAHFSKDSFNKHFNWLRSVQRTAKLILTHEMPFFYSSCPTRSKCLLPRSLQLQLELRSTNHSSSMYLYVRECLSKSDFATELAGIGIGNRETEARICLSS